MLRHVHGNLARVHDRARVILRLSSTRPRPNRSATSFWIDSIVILRACESMKFLSTCCAYGRVLSAPIGGLLLFRHVAIFALEAFTDIVKKARECFEERRKPIQSKHDYCRSWPLPQHALVLKITLSLK